jgi:hypothetical protein
MCLSLPGKVPNGVMLNNIAIQPPEADLAKFHTNIAEEWWPWSGSLCAGELFSDQVTFCAA